MAHIKGRKSHSIIQQGLKILENLDHRGAVGADKLMGDGAGILIQIPDALYHDELAQQGIVLPPPGEYGVAMVFLPKETASRLACEQELERSVRAEGQIVLGWRDVPVDVEMPMSPAVRGLEPVIRQLFIGRGADVMVPDALERKLYVIRKTASHAIQNMRLAHSKEYFVPSASVRTVVYKGLLLADQVGRYYRDLADPRTVSALALVHQRFSTNTFPAWPLAHPYRMIAHNGEINTVKGNFNWLRAREGMMQSAVLGDDLKKLYPIVYEGQSDTATFDNCLELLVNSGYSLAHAMMMMIPEAWEQHTQMDESRRAFYEYHAAMMEPWDGPAAVAFTDGRQIGATLDRNGLRPARYLITDDDMVIMASEAGTLSIPENRIVKKWRLQPGKGGHAVDPGKPHRQEMAPATGQDVPDRPGAGPHHRRRRDQAAAGQQPPVPPMDRTPAGQAGIAARAQDRLAGHPDGRAAARPPAGVRLDPGGFQVHPRTHGRQRRGSDRLDGQRCPAGRAVEPLQAVLQLLPPTVRASDQPADRPDPRADGHVAGLVHRPQAQPARHQQRQPAAAPGSDAARAGFRRHGADPRHRPGHRQEIPQL
ncbi:class II glutamine amidotransferase [Bordetella pertussis H973]|nr:class II glutamine amidotransferase [Bordetella pertussis H973]